MLRSGLFLSTKFSLFLYCCFISFSFFISFLLISPIVNADTYSPQENIDTSDPYNEKHYAIKGEQVGNSHIVIDTGGNYHITGALLEGANAVTQNNTIILNGGTSRRIIAGSRSENTDTASALFNRIIVNNGNFYNVTASEIESNKAISSYHDVQINGGIIDWVYGVNVESNEATSQYNTIEVNNGSIKYIRAVYMYHGDANMSYNTINIHGGTIDDVRNVDAVYLGKSTASHNTIFIDGNSNLGLVAGGELGGNYIENSHNSIIMRSGTVNGIRGGSVMSSGWMEHDDTGIYAHNFIEISGGTVQVILGGEVGIARVNAHDNTILIRGGTIQNGDITAIFGVARLSAEIRNNKVIIMGNPKLEETTFTGVEFGWWRKDGDDEIIENNALEIHTKDLNALNIRAFNNYHFYLPADIQAGDIVLVLTDTAGTDISKSELGIGVDSFTPLLKNGDKIVLVINSNGLDTTGYTEKKLTVQQGSTIDSDFTLTADSTSLYVTAHISASKASKALSEGYLGGTVLAMQGADHAALQGMDSIQRTVREVGAYQLTPFGSVSSGIMRYDTGSHIDMKSYSMLAGLVYGMDLRDNAENNLVLGGFFEYGNGSYDTYNSFGNADDSTEVRGEGDSYYFGLGVLGHLDFSSVLIGQSTGNFYVEASARLGRMHNEFNSDDLTDALGRRAEYDSHTPYCSLHLGTGFDWQMTETSSLDFYAKYFWTHLQGDTLDLSTGEKLDFDSVNSHRLRIGGRYNHAYTENIQPYFGLAYEYEFDGTMSATTNGFAIGEFDGEPDLKGSTGIAEIGLSLAAYGNMSIDLGLQGYMGKREGVTGNVVVNWEF